MTLYFDGFGTVIVMVILSLIELCKRSLLTVYCDVVIVMPIMLEMVLLEAVYVQMVMVCIDISLLACSFYVQMVCNT